MSFGDLSGPAGLSSLQGIALLDAWGTARTHGTAARGPRCRGVRPPPSPVPCRAAVRCRCRRALGVGRVDALPGPRMCRRPDGSPELREKHACLVRRLPGRVPRAHRGPALAAARGRKHAVAGHGRRHARADPGQAAAHPHGGPRQLEQGPPLGDTHSPARGCSVACHRAASMVEIEDQAKPDVRQWEPELSLTFSLCCTFGASRPGSLTGSSMTLTTTG